MSNTSLPLCFVAIEISLSIRLTNAQSNDSWVLYNAPSKVLPEVNAVRVHEHHTDCIDNTISMVYDGKTMV